MTHKNELPIWRTGSLLGTGQFTHWSAWSGKSSRNSLRFTGTGFQEKLILPPPRLPIGGWDFNVGSTDHHLPCFAFLLLMDYLVLRPWVFTFVKFFFPVWGFLSELPCLYRRGSVVMPLFIYCLLVLVGLSTRSLSCCFGLFGLLYSFLGLLAFYEIHPLTKALPCRSRRKVKLALGKQTSTERTSRLKGSEKSQPQEVDREVVGAEAEHCPLNGSLYIQCVPVLYSKAQEDGFPWKRRRERENMIAEFLVNCTSFRWWRLSFRTSPYGWARQRQTKKQKDKLL